MFHSNEGILLHIRTDCIISNKQTNKDKQANDRSRYVFNRDFHFRSFLCYRMEVNEMRQTVAPFSDKTKFITLIDKIIELSSLKI